MSHTRKLSQAWNPKDKDCRNCGAKAGDQCKDFHGREKDTCRSRG